MPAKRDLSLSTPLSSDKSYTEQRLCVPNKKFDSHIIEDISSTDIQIIDSIEKVNLIY